MKRSILAISTMTLLLASCQNVTQNRLRPFKPSTNHPPADRKNSGPIFLDGCFKKGEVLMTKIRGFLFAFVAFLLSINLANATCTGPSGVYSGVASYLKYTGSAVLDVAYEATITASITYNSASSTKPVSVSLTTVIYYNGSTSGTSSTVTTTSSTFSTTTCLGSIVSSSGVTYKFAVTGSGQEINFLITPPTTAIFYFPVQTVLKKV